MAAPKRIGILTGGGDCPGLNAVIRAVAKTAMFEYDIEVVGIEDGYRGLIEGRVRRLESRDVSNILTLGGTILGSCNRSNPSHFATGKNPDGTPIFEDVTDRCMATIEKHGIEALVVIGGDGTMAGTRPFIERGINCIGVPKTIDNDLPGTEITFGFLTAVQIATDALDRIHTTAASHHRVMIVEVMGRNSGWIALYAGVASGADVILIPERPYDLDAICEFVQHRSSHGKRFSIICISEGATMAGGSQVVSRVDPTSPDPIRLGGIGEQLGDDITKRTGQDTRTTVLGHVQRGGTPIAADRLLGTSFGHHAMELLAAGERNRLVVRVGGRFTDIDLATLPEGQRLVGEDNPLVMAARAVGTCFG